MSTNLFATDRNAYVAGLLRKFYVCHMTALTPLDPRLQQTINNRRKNVRYVREDNFSDNDNQEEDNMPFGMYNRQSANIDSRILVPVMLNGDTKELDTGASVSVVSEETWKHDLNSIQLQHSGIKLTTYTGELLNVIGKVDIEVSYEVQNAWVPLHVLEGNAPSLMGRNWLHSIKLNWGSINKMSSKLDEVFQEELGVFKNVKATLHVRPDTTPKFCKPRSAPYALHEPSAKELDRLIQQGVLEKVEYSECVAPIVAAMKPDGNVQRCGDYKVTINQYVEVDKHPLPKTEDLFVELSGGGEVFKIRFEECI